MSWRSGGVLRGALCFAAMLGSAVSQAPEGAPGLNSDCTPLAEALEMNSLGELDALLSAQGGQEMAFNLASTVEIPDIDKVTIFAPDNAALEATPAGNLTSEVVFNHVVLDYLPSVALFEDMDALSLAGVVSITSGAAGDLTITAPGMPTPAKIAMPDIATCIGVVHVVDSVITRTDDGSASLTPTAGSLTGAAPGPTASRGFSTPPTGSGGGGGDGSSTSSDQSTDADVETPENSHAGAMETVLGSSIVAIMVAAAFVAA